MVAREEHCLWRQLGELAGQRLIQGVGVTAGKIDSAAALDEQGVARHQSVPDQKALTAGRVPRGVNELDLHITEFEDGATVHLAQITVRYSGDDLEAVGFVPIDPDRHPLTLEQLGQTVDLEAEEIAADVVRMVMGHQGADHLVAVFRRPVEQPHNIPGRVDDDRLAAGRITDQVHEIGHLPRHRMGGRNLLAGQQLLEVERIVSHRGAYASIRAGLQPTESVMSRGFIIPIGGAEDRTRDPAILHRFVELSGAAGARIAIIPTASSRPDTGRDYEDIFAKLGVDRARTLAFATRRDCEREDWLEVLANATGVYLTGGNQLKLSTTLGGTSVAELLRDRNQDGLHVAGTSAGAAFLCEHMIAFGQEGATPRSDMVTLAPGLGLTRLAIIDQHFRQRDRLGRLLTALAYNPRPIGIGLDEDTAAFLGPDETLEVLGSGAITIIDPSDVEYTSMDSAAAHDPVCILGARLHVLVEGASYNISTRQPKPPRRLTARSA